MPEFSVSLPEVSDQPDAFEVLAGPFETAETIPALDYYRRAIQHNPNRAAELWREAVVSGLEDKKGRANAENYDELTGLRNNGNFVEAVEAIAGGTDREQDLDRKHTLIFLDLDNFGALNKKHGQLFGDKVLTDVAYQLRSALREEDVVGRLGGEEFGILLLNTDVEHAKEVAERVQAAVNSLSYEHDGGNIPMVGATLGVAEYKQGEDYENVLDKSDKSHTAGKNQTEEKNRIVYWSPENDEHIRQEAAAYADRKLSKNS